MKALVIVAGGITDARAGAATRHTALTTVLTGRTARGIVNRIVREVGPMSAQAPRSLRRRAL